MLELLQPTGVTPRLVAFFQQGGRQFSRRGGRGGPDAAGLERRPVGGRGAAAAARRWPWRRKVATALAVVHQHGVIVRDFTPNNLIVQPDGHLRLIDLELAVRRTASTATRPISTPGTASLTPPTGARARPPA